MQPADRGDRARACLLGLAVGDALGAPLEFSSAEAAAAAVGAGLEMKGGGVWDPGEWTDDTAMALCLAEALAVSGLPLDLDDLASRYASWAASGPKDIGITTRRALGGAGSAEQARANARASHEESGRTAGNGTVMRVAALAFAPGSRDEVLDAAREDARLTHWDEVAGDASAGLCAALLAIETDQDPVAAALSAAGDHPRLTDALGLVARDDRDAIARLAAGGEGGTCWATLATGLFTLRFSSYEEGVGWAISHGFDTDTNAAVAGALLARRDGVEPIPGRWLDRLRNRDRIEAAADGIARAHGGA
jgi:ADP-ribosylglycohydrolase